MCVVGSPRTGMAEGAPRTWEALIAPRLGGFPQSGGEGERTVTVTLVHRLSVLQC